MSMSIALGTSLHSSCGWKVSGPVFAVSALVAFQRLDAGFHDLDDLLMGSVLGFVVSRELHSTRGLEVLGAEVGPCIHPNTGAVGLGLTWTR